MKVKKYKQSKLSIGKSDKNGDNIFEGDIVYSKFLDKKIKIEDFTEFLMFCGAFNERHGIDIFDSLEIVKDDK